MKKYLIISVLQFFVTFSTRKISVIQLEYDKILR